MQANLHLKKKKEKTQAGNELSNILPKSSHARKKPPPITSHHYSPCPSCYVVGHNLIVEKLHCCRLESIENCKYVVECLHGEVVFEGEYDDLFSVTKKFKPGSYGL